MNNESQVSVFYEKTYIDSVSRHIPALFKSNEIDNIAIKRYWQNGIDAFISYACMTYITCITGDIRIIIPYEQGNGYKFNQYFVSELDGKVIKIPNNIWFGINNMKSTESTIMIATSKTLEPKRMDKETFKWN
jgi:hypothetical protein